MRYTRTTTSNFHLYVSHNRIIRVVGFLNFYYIIYCRTSTEVLLIQLRFEGSYIASILHFSSLQRMIAGAHQIITVS